MERVGLGGWKWDPGVETGRFRGGMGSRGWKRVGLGVEMGSRGWKRVGLGVEMGSRG